jgi:hypothetical protein
LENLSASTIYDIANSIKDNAFADELLGGLLSDAATSWSSGETFFGYSREDLGENGIIDSICEVLSNNANASEALLAVGHVYSVAQVMNLVGNTTDGTQSTEDVMTDLMSNLTDDSIDIVQKLVSETLTTAIGNQGADLTDDQLSKISEFVGDLLKELKKVQDGGNEEEIKKEATAVSTVFDAVKTAKSMTEDEARDLVVSVKDSTVLINSLDKFVADNPNPLNIETSDELKEQINKALDSLEITPDDKVYNIVMKFFGLEI